MGLSVVGMEGKNVVIESDCDGSGTNHFAPAFEELTDMEARRMAQVYAAEHGVNSPANGVPSAPYPVDEAGSVVENRGQKVFRYRIDIPVIARLHTNIV